ncbi:MAG: large subunit ribosomal protein [Acidimicrobiaceae bacterium]|jgi:large subunit ribosomal protein L24
MSGLRVKKGDRVRVLTGKDRGKEGNVTRVLPSKEKVIVDGVNVAKKSQKPTRSTMQGGIIDRDMPLDVSNVAVLCPKGHPTRVGYKFNTDGTKSRVCKKCGADLS